MDDPVLFKRSTEKKRKNNRECAKGAKEERKEELKLKKYDESLAIMICLAMVKNAKEERREDMNG